MKNSIGIVLSVFIFAVTSNVHAGDAAVGKAKSNVCASCHGVDGVSTIGLNPSLAGQKKPYLIKAMKDFRGGKRKNTMMNSMASGLSDNDIENLATYYSGLK